MKGQIRWFNFKKGYGFIIPDDGEPDDFLHIEDVHMTHRQSLLPTAKVEFIRKITPRGSIAKSVTVLNVQYDTWYLPHPCSHKLAVKDLLDGTVAVFNTHDEIKAWINRRKQNR